MLKLRLLKPKISRSENIRPSSLSETAERFLKTAVPKHSYLLDIILNGRKSYFPNLNHFFNWDFKKLRTAFSKILRTAWSHSSIIHQEHFFYGTLSLATFGDRAALHPTANIYFFKVKNGNIGNVSNLFKINNEDTRMMSSTLFCSGFFIVVYNSDEAYLNDVKYILTVAATRMYSVK